MDKAELSPILIYVVLLVKSPTLSVRIIMATRLFIFWKKYMLHALIRRLHDYQFSSKSIQMLQFVYNYHIKTPFLVVPHDYLVLHDCFIFMRPWPEGPWRIKFYSFIIIMVRGNLGLMSSQAYKYVSMSLIESH